MCTKISDVEWSGILFFSETEGSIDNPDSLVLTLEEILPGSKDSSAYTSFETADIGLMSFLMANPDRINYHQGYIHSHNKMKVFFSATDMSELRDNCVNHNYYVSVIVNNMGEVCAKIAIHVEDEHQVTGTKRRMNSRGEQIEVPYLYTTSYSLMEHYDCKVILPKIKVDKEFAAKVEEIIEKAKPKTPATQGVQGSLFFNQPVRSKVSVTDFVAKFIALDLTFDKFTYDAMEEVEKLHTGETDAPNSEDYVAAFDELFDNYFDDSDISEIEAISKIRSLIKTYENTFPISYKVLCDACDELMTGIDEDQYDLANPKNINFYGR